MRLFAWVPANVEGIQWLILYEDPDVGAYLFGSLRTTDGADWDQWYESVVDAQESAVTEYGVLPDAWQQIPDPLEHCQYDWIQPVRVKGRNLGHPEWGTLEKLVNGKWLEFDPENEKPLSS